MGGEKEGEGEGKRRRVEGRRELLYTLRTSFGIFLFLGNSMTLYIIENTTEA